MPRPTASLRARLAVAGTAGLLTAALVPGAAAPPATAAPSAAARVEAEPTPLRVSLTRLTPSTLTPGRPVTVAGRVTNVDDVTWSTINVYPVLGDDAPITSESELAEAADLPEDAVVGERITEVRTTIDELEPGESARYRIRVPARLLRLTEPGVYWFGVHTLGASEDTPQDGFTDGRARTFLPLAPDQGRDDASRGRAGRLQDEFAVPPRVPTSLVLPVRHYVDHRPGGALAHPGTWLRSVTSGRLHDLVRVGEAAQGRDLTWLVDPAVLDAVQRLARGNPPRSLTPTVPPDRTGDDDADQDDDQDDDESGSPSPSEEPSATDDGTEEQQGEDVDQAPVGPEGRLAQDWLDRMARQLQGGEVLSLPYGDVDLPAAAEHGPGLLDLAQGRVGRVLSSLGVEPTAAVAPPDGALDEATLDAVDERSLVLLDDTSFDTGTATPTVLDQDGRTVLAASTGAASGGPGPGDPLDAVALRQRILSEAALRLLGTVTDGDTGATGSSQDPEPLVVTLPESLDPDRAPAFFSGLDVDWLDLGGLDDVVRAGPGAASDGTRGADEDTTPSLLYPDRAADLELDASTVGAAEDLVDAGDTLQSLLSRNDEVGDDVADQALTGVSYEARGREDDSRGSMEASTRRIARTLGGVRISAPPGVTLSSSSGNFAVTVTNRLDEPVTVGVGARGDGGVQVEPSETIELGPGSRTTVLLQAEATEIATHNVTLRVLDVDGDPLGSTDVVSIRSAQVSDVIWLIIGTGVGLLLLAVVVRLARRIRAARRSGDGASGATAARQLAGASRGSGG